jgi:hypothetical protein
VADADSRFGWVEYACSGADYVARTAGKLVGDPVTWKRSTMRVSSVSCSAPPITPRKKRREEIYIRTTLKKQPGAALPPPGGKQGRFNLNHTGCRYVYNMHAVHGVYDPLGTDQPQPGWPHPKPTLDEIRKALH